jgi:hypothetical protein
LTLAVPWNAHAHNESVHQRMTDFAYHVLLAGSAFSKGERMSGRLRTLLDQLEKTDPGLTQFYADAVAAVPKLRALKSGLPNDTTPCIDPFLINQMGGAQPDWQLPVDSTLDELPMGDVRLPVGIHYGHGVTICAIDATYAPSGLLASVNPGGFTGRDHTGVTLGYWAAAPDKETKDWVLRSTTLETLQNPIILSQIAAATSVAVTSVCLLACGLFPPACAACPFLGVGAGGIVIDEITSIDADSLESEDYVGFGHFVDMKPTPAFPPSSDEKPAKLMERAGPTGTTDLTEDLVILLFDLGGIHVNHAESQAPKHYEIVLGASGAIGDDFHRNSTTRSPAEWETATIPHLQLSAVDNLGMFGYQEAKANRGTPLEAKRIGWPLHALGDASVPMHAVGASGYGHRPYEDSVDMVYDSLVGSGSVAASAPVIGEVVKRAFKWRKFIQKWRADHATTEVPVRDLITAVADVARSKASAQPTVFKPLQSVIYIADQDAAIAAYDNATMAAIQRDLLLEGIAAEVAFLMAVTEVTP